MDSSKIWELADRVGGVFKLTVLLQKRVQELVRGAPKLVDNPSDDFAAIALQELEEGKIVLEKLSEAELEEGAQERQDEIAAERSILGEDKPANSTGIL